MGTSQIKCFKAIIVVQTLLNFYLRLREHFQHEGEE